MQSNRTPREARYRSAPCDWPLIWQYVLAISLVAAALAFRGLLEEDLGGRVPFAVLFSALLPLVILVRPAPFFVAALLGFLFSWWAFFQPIASFSVAPGRERLLLSTFAFMLGATALAAWLSHRSRDRRLQDQLALRSADRALQLRSEQFETLINEAPVGVYLIDADFCVLQVNPMAAPVFAGFPEGVIGHDFKEVIYKLWQPDYADEIVRKFRRTLETGEPYRTTERAEMRADTGRLEYYAWEIDRITLPDGCHGVVCYFQDVSEQARARHAIALSEARYRTLFNSISEGFCVLKVLFDDHGAPADYRFLEMNPAFERHTGLTNAAGKTVLELVPDLERRWVDIYGRVAVTGEPERMVEHSIAMNRWFEVEAFRTGAPEQHHVALLFRDITKSKSAEEALAREVMDHKRVQEISCRLIPTDDVQTLYSELVDAAVEITQADRGTMQLLDAESNALKLLQARGFPDHMREQFTHTRPSARTSCAEAWARGERVVIDYASDPRVAGSGDARAHLELGIRMSQSTPLITRSGRFVGILTTHWDSTQDFPERSRYLIDVLARQAADLIERAQSDEALRAADRRKDEFLATLGHELRNPMAAIRMAMAVLGKVSNDPNRVEEMASIVDRQTSALVRLIDDLLDISRISRGKVQLERALIDLNSIVNNAYSDAVTDCEAKRIRASLSLPQHAVNVVGDPIRLSQVVNNLMHNACKFTPEEGTVALSLECTAEDAIIRVSDTGIGLPPEQQSRIFDMFTQVGAVDHGSIGLGIGLSLAKSIVELHDGQIAASSSGPGQGSEFVVRLPLPVSEAVESAGAPMASSESGALYQPVDDEPQSVGQALNHPRDQSTVIHRIVAADDNVDALSAVTLVLRMNGHQVETAVDGREALDKICEQRPDVALLDIGMPHMDGYEVARRIRQERWGAFVLLVAMTGWGQNRDKQQAIEAGFDVHMTKPVDPIALEQLLAQHRRGTADNTVTDDPAATTNTTNTTKTGNAEGAQTGRR